MRRIRLFSLVLVIAALLAGVAFAGVKIYLGSNLAAQRFAARVGEVYGGAVRIDSLDVAMDKTTVRGIHFFEMGDLPVEEPWLSVEEMQADLSFMNLAFDSTRVTEIALNRPTITLRFDKEGHLLTRVPSRQTQTEPLPTLAIHDGIVHLQQEGHKEFVANAINATLSLHDGGLIMEGTVSDPYWGEWTASGHYSFEKLFGQLNLTNGGTHLSQEKLSNLPFVSPFVWEAVQLDGDTPVDFTFSYDFPANRTNYVIDLHPVHTKLFVTSINLHAEDAQGNVRVENGAVILKDVHGRSADGEINTSAELHCRKDPKEMHFKIGVERLDLRKLPTTWHLPKQLVGRLDGSAELQVTVKNHQARTFGKGEGIVKNGRFAGLPVKEMKILLTADGSGFHFKPVTSNSRQTP